VEVVREIFMSGVGTRVQTQFKHIKERFNAYIEETIQCILVEMMVSLKDGKDKSTAPSKIVTYLLIQEMHLQIGKKLLYLTKNLAF
jgi:hypothetical protein